MARYRYKKSEYLKALQAELKPMVVAGHAAIREAGQIAVKESKAHVAARGFKSRRWQGFRSKVTPPRPRKDLDVVATITHRPGYAVIFEEGGVIKGKPLLWLPITANLPRAIRARWTPRRFISRLGRLAKVPGRPLLVGKVKGKSVPVFHGVEQVTIRKRWNTAAVVEGVAERVAELYYKNFLQRNR